MDTEAPIVPVSTDNNIISDFVEPTIERWDCFTILGKPALFYYVGDAYSNDYSLLIQKREDGNWYLSSFLGDEWEINEVCSIYSISENDDISSISLKFKNISSMDGWSISDTDIISEFLSVFKTSIVLSRETWGTENSLLEIEENDAKLVLLIDIFTSSGHNLSLQLYPYANCLTQNGDCIYALGDNSGEYLFNLFTGSTTEDFKHSINKE